MFTGHFNKSKSCKHTIFINDKSDNQVYRPFGERVLVNPFSSATFHGANRFAAPKCYKIATKLLRIYYEFDCAPGVDFGDKKRKYLVDVFIVKHLIVRGYKDNKKLEMMFNNYKKMMCPIL